MGINHREPAYTDKAAPFIEEFGGKIGGLKYLRDTTDLAQHVLPITALRPNESWGKRVPNLVHNIVRASHPHDFQGLVNVIDSQKVNVQKRKIGEVIDDIRASARDELVIAYAQYENPAYNGDITVGIQSLMDRDTLHSDAFRRGSIIEHPNQPGSYLIEWVEEWEDIMGHQQRELTSGMYNDKGELAQALNLMDAPPNSAAEFIGI